MTAVSIHLSAKPDEIAPHVLMPGDPLRARWIAETFLEDGLFYAYVSTATDNRVVRFPLGGTPNPVFTGIPRGEVHNGGGLVFGGAPDGYLRAFDDTTGEVLWQFQTGSGLYAPPTSFTIDGKQYIGIASGFRQPVTRAGVGSGQTPGAYILFGLQ